MDTTTDPQPPDGEPSLDELAAYALDALDPDEERAVAAAVADDPAAAAAHDVLRAAAGEYGASAEVALPGPPPPDLRDRVLAAAHTRRAPAPLEPATETAVHRLEASRALDLLARLDPPQWERPVHATELGGWRVREVVAHLCAGEELLAERLGNPVVVLPEQGLELAPRTASVQQRLRSRSPREAVDELAVAVAAVHDGVEGLAPEEHDRPIGWWHGPTPVRTALLLRTFETWTHADDIRDALGAPRLPPPAPSLHTMARAAVALLPDLLAADGASVEAGIVRVVLTGPGGGAWTVALPPTLRPRPDEGAGVAEAELTVDVVDYCRAVARRQAPDRLDHTLTGDPELGRRVLHALPALAVL